MSARTPRYCPRCGTLQRTARLARACCATNTRGRPPRAAFCSECGASHPSVTAARLCARADRGAATMPTNLTEGLRLLAGSPTDSAAVENFFGQPEIPVDTAAAPCNNNSDATEA